MDKSIAVLSSIYVNTRIAISSLFRRKGFWSNVVSILPIPVYYLSMHICGVALSVLLLLLLNARYEKKYRYSILNLCINILFFLFISPKLSDREEWTWPINSRRHQGTARARI